MNILLPTAPIIQEHKGFEAIFCFYEDGIKGLVRDLVVRLAERPSTEEASRAFIDRVIYDYECSLHVRYLENTYGAEYPQWVIETVIVWLEKEIDDMLAPFRIERFTITSRHILWIGNDLFTKIHFIKPSDDTYQFHLGSSRRVA